MTSPKTAKRLVLDRQHLIAMVVDPGFYTACPHFLWMKDTAIAAHAAYQASKGCCGSDWKIMRPVIDAFFADLQQVRAQDPPVIEGIRAYLAARRGSVIGAVVVYYRRAKEPHPAKFTF